MLNFLFPRLTPAAAERGAATFAAVVAIARRPGPYRDCRVPDTVDGRFAVLATVLALLLVRLENDGDKGDALSVAVTERFIAAMESEHRELGLGDPTLGKTVRKLVGALSRRVDSWRSAIAGGDWAATARSSLYQGEPEADALDRAVDWSENVWSAFAAADLAAIATGDIA